LCHLKSFHCTVSAICTSVTPLPNGLLPLVFTNFCSIFISLTHAPCSAHLILLAFREQYFLCSFPVLSHIEKNTIQFPINPVVDGKYFKDMQSYIKTVGSILNSRKNMRESIASLDTITLSQYVISVRVQRITFTGHFNFEADYSIISL